MIEGGGGLLGDCAAARDVNMNVHSTPLHSLQVASDRDQLLESLQVSLFVVCAMPGVL
jgi:hypothetical protein